MPAAPDHLSTLLARCLTRDHPRLRARLGRARTPDERAALERDLERSAARAAERRARLPRPEFDPALPVNERRDEIAAAIDAHQVIVLCGETGSGKTTQLPKVCLALGRGARGLIGHTQPRRIAARAVAARLAEELSDASAVGCKVRFTDETRPDNAVKVMTDGILLAETRSDPDLSAYDTIIIDEAHERTLTIDFLLGYLRRLLPRRPDLKLIITSATIDPRRFAAHFAGPGGDPAPIIEVSGRTYPVEIRYRPIDAEPDGDQPDEDEPTLQSAILRAVDELAAPGMPAGDILIFLSGEREIRETAENLAKHHVSGAARGGVTILPLYARLSADEQQRVFRTTPGRRIILATNVAETSLTVPGIRYVIDQGLARVSRYSPRTKVQRLPIEPISRASANQRAGRCGRLSDGVCIRLYSKEDFDSRPPFTDPEIQRANLAAVILQMASLRLGSVDRFPFIDPPDPRMIRDGEDTLIELGAIAPAATGDPAAAPSGVVLTEIGRALARFPVDPRIARMILAADTEGCLDDMLIVAAGLEVQDPRERPADAADRADQAHARFDDPNSDFVASLKLWAAYHERRTHLSGSALRRWCREHFISYVRMREWCDVHSQLKELAGELNLRTGSRTSGVAEPTRPPRQRSSRPEPGARSPAPDFAPLHRAILTGLLSSIGTLPDQAKPGPSRFEYHGPRGLRFHIFPGSGLFRKNPKWLVAAEIVKTTRPYARTVAAVRPEWIEHAGAHLLRRSYLDPHWDDARAQVRARERITLLGLELVPGRMVHFGPVDPKASREIFIHHALVAGEYWSNHPFARHNAALLARVEALQHRLRARDFALDLHARFAFFDARLPADVYSGQAFERWLRAAQRDDPRILFMSMKELLQPGWGIDPDTLARDYPDHLSLDARHPAGTPQASASASKDADHLRIPLEYLYQPGHPSDGVTAIVPLAHLPALTERRAQWLIPGLIEEKIVALIRTLPKDTRRTLVPVPDFAEKALEHMTFAAGDLLIELASTLGRLSGVAIDPADFDPGVLAPELRLNIRVTDGRTVLAEGRDLAELHARLRGEIRAAIATAEASPWNRDGLTDWDFQTLPHAVDVLRSGMRFTAYPAIVDPRVHPAAPGARPGPSRSVSLRLFDSPERAARATAFGLRRLFSLRARDEIRWHIDHARALPAMLVAYAPIGDAKDLKEDLADLIAQRAFLEADAPPITSRAEFEACLRVGMPRLEAAATEVLALAAGILAARQGLALRFPQAVAPVSAPCTLPAPFHPAIADIRLQLAALLPPGFVGATPWDRLAHIPRYLQAVERRLARLTSAGVAGAERDTPLMDQVRPHWVRYLDAARRAAEAGRVVPALDDLRWLIEEFRVSLFAQELGTIEPVSAKRLDRRWEGIA